MNRGILYMLLSAVGLSFFGLFVKLGTSSVSFFLLTFLRFLVPLLLILPLFIWKIGIPKFTHLSHFYLLLGRVGCLLIYQYAIFYYLSKSSLLTATVLLNTAPFFIPLMERVFMQHQIRKELIFGMLVSFLGVLFILKPTEGIMGWNSWIGLVAALGQAGSQIFFGLQSRSEKNATNLFYLFFFSMILSFVLFLAIAPFEQGIGFEIESLRSVDQIFYWCLLGLGLATISNQAFRGMAYQHARPGILAPILYVSVPVSGVLDWVFFDQLPDRWSALGTVLVIFGGIIPFIEQKIERHHENDR